MSKAGKRQRSRRRKKGPVMPMLLTAYNYKILAIGVLCVLIGFGGMYIEGQQYGIYSLYIAPLLVMAGFILVAVAVFKTPPGQMPAESGQEQNKEHTAG